MLRTVARLSPNFIIPIFQTRNKNDIDLINDSKIRDTNSGWDRVKAMYGRNEHEEVSLELHNVVQSSLSGAFIGACIGGFLHSRQAYLYYIESNQATIFSSMPDAKKKLQDFVTVAFAKGACKWGWKLGIFTGIFSLIAATVSVYRGDNSLVDYVTAGAITGALYKANLGAAATFVGATLGATLSAIAGAAILGLLHVTGLSMTDIRQAMYKITESREYHFEQAVEKCAKIKHDELTKHHDTLVEEKGQAKVEQL